MRIDSLTRVGRLRLRTCLVLPALGLCTSVASFAATTTLTVADATKGTSSSPVTMLFPLTRSGDSGYDVTLGYHTENGTAAAGVDYTAADASSVFYPGVGASIPVIIDAYPFNGPDRTFQLILDSATGIGPTPSFGPAQTFATAGSGFSVAVADLNGDGKPDLIVANNSDYSVSVLLNTSVPGTTTPTFAAQQRFATGSAPVSVSVADVNGDGKPDLIVANIVDNTVSVLLNTTPPGATTPTFAVEQAFPVGMEPINVTTADINGDGKPDLIAANMDDNTVSVLLNTTAPGATTATFAAQQVFATGTRPYYIVATDINGDGKPDIAVSNIDGGISVLLNSTLPGASTPSFAAQQIFETGTNFVSLAAADVNGDGKPDLIAANGSDNKVSVLLNTTATGASTASFAEVQNFGTLAAPYSVVAADINGDGKPDVIVTQETGNAVSVLLNTTSPGASTPSFGTQIDFPTGSGPVAVSVRDINGDGRADLVVMNNGDDTVSVLANTTALGTVAPDFAAQQTFATGGRPTSVAAGDINGDGKPALVLTNSNDNSISVLMNTTAPGAATPAFADQITFATGLNPMAIAAADINGDGKPDMIVTNCDEPTASMLLNTTVPGSMTPSFALQQKFPIGTCPYSVAAADINGDGKSDVIAVGPTVNKVSVLINTTATGDTTLSFGALQTFTTGTGPDFVAVADVNGDGKPDLIVANSNDNTISVLLNTTAPGAALASFAARNTFNVGLNPSSIAAVDINGDGLLDLIVTNEYANSLSILLNTTAPGAATASFAPQQTFATGRGPFATAVVDVNGDGRPDLITTNFADATMWVLLNTTAPGSSTLTFASPQIVALGASPFYFVTADVNGDGKPDVIAVNQQDNEVSVLLNGQYLVAVGAPATGTIVHDDIFANGFE